ncbi:MAG: LamG-like jellyroll fold domain-containing protein [Planctomycetota bacterium]
MRNREKNRTVSTGAILAAVAGATLTAGHAAAQPAITWVGGFAQQFWNANGQLNGDDEWRSEAPATNWNEGLRWVFQETDGMGAILPSRTEPVFDPTVPGIEKAFRMPASRAATINPDGTGNRGANWENQATAGTPGTFEIWFKPDDLVGNHVIWEIGASNKGIAICLEGADLVFSTAANDGMGGNAYTTIHRTTLTNTGWHQAVITIDYISYIISSYHNGQPVTSEMVPASSSYRWSGANPAGLGTLGSDPAFPDSGVAADPIDPLTFTDFNGLIGIHRFYNFDLFASEALGNYNAIIDAAAITARGDYNGDGSVNNTDQFDLITFASNANTDPITDFSWPFPATEGGVQTNDPALDDTFGGDFWWQRDDGFNPTSTQEPSFQFPAMNVLEPVTILDPMMPNVREAFVLNGVEGFRGPKLEQAEDTSATTVFFWMFFDDVTGNHCLFEAGGATGLSVFSLGDELVAAINTTAPTLDALEISSGAGVLTPGWHRIDFVVRRFASATQGQGIELYLDGTLVAQDGDLPGPDGEFGTADDINQWNVGNGGSTNYIGGNQSGYGNFQGAVLLPAGLTTGDLDPVNGMAGPISILQTQPTEADIQAQIAQNSGQNTINLRSDVNDDSEANFFDILEQLKMIDAGR